MPGFENMFSGNKKESVQGAQVKVISGSRYHFLFEDHRHTKTKVIENRHGSSGL